MLLPVVGVLFDGVAYGMLLFLLSVGLSVTLGMMNFVNLAHCSFAMLGGYVTVTAVQRLGWPFLAALPVFVPYGVWVEIYAGRIARGEHAAAFLVHMAGQGEIRAVRALLDEGVPIDARNPRGLRAIDAAERQRQSEMRRFLVARGGAADPRRPQPRRTDQATQ